MVVIAVLDISILNRLHRTNNAGCSLELNGIFFDFDHAQPINDYISFNLSSKLPQAKN